MTNHHPVVGFSFQKYNVKILIPPVGLQKLPAKNFGTPRGADRLQLPGRINEAGQAQNPDYERQDQLKSIVHHGDRKK